MIAMVMVSVSGSSLVSRETNAPIVRAEKRRSKRISWRSTYLLGLILATTACVTPEDSAATRPMAVRELEERCAEAADAVVAKRRDTPSLIVLLTQWQPEDPPPFKTSVLVIWNEGKKAQLFACRGAKLAPRTGLKSGSKAKKVEALMLRARKTIASECVSEATTRTVRNARGEIAAKLLALAEVNRCREVDGLLEKLELALGD